MPSFTRITLDQTVEAIALTQPIAIDTPFGKVSGKPGDWLITDYLGRPELYDYATFVAKFDPANQQATDYLALWKPKTPEIIRIEPTRGTVGTTVYIEGKRFLATQGQGKVYFGLVHEIEAPITSWSDQEIVCTVPAGLPTEYSVEVWVRQVGRISNTMPFQAV